MKYLTAEKQATGYYFLIHMDETKPQTPDNIKEYKWGISLKPDGTFDNTKGYATEADYTAMMKREIPLLVADELKRISTPTPAPTPLAGF